jgi:hypothetical protein
LDAGVQIGRDTEWAHGRYRTKERRLGDQTRIVWAVVALPTFGKSTTVIARLALVFQAKSARRKIQAEFLDLAVSLATDLQSSEFGG